MVTGFKPIDARVRVKVRAAARLRIADPVRPAETAASRGASLIIEGPAT